MDTATQQQDLRIFHLTGQISGAELAPVTGLRPALLADVSNLTRLRYDWPVVLVDEGEASGSALSLSEAVDALLARLAPRGPEGDPLRRAMLGLEAELRAMLAASARGRLSRLWTEAVRRRGATAPADAQAVLEHAGLSLDLDGELVDCDAGLPTRLIRHAWQAEQRAKAIRFHALVDELVRQLSAILRAAFFNSEAGRQPAALRAGVGPGNAADFDFDILSRLVVRGLPADELPPGRRARIEAALATLATQAFHPDPRDAEPDGLNFCFDNCAAAMTAWHERLPAVVDLVRAMAIAQLETRGAYLESEHGPFFSRFSAAALTADDLELFPDYLVCPDPAHNASPDNAGLIEMLSSGLPVKVLVQLDELLEDAPLGGGHYAFGVRGARLATTAMGLGGMFVLQATASNLYALRHRLARGLACRGPALFCVYAAAPSGSLLPPALHGGAAMDSRAFPSFTYDATAGSDWASRFSLENNRDPEADWPLETLEYATAGGQRQSLALAFTYADFVLADPPHSGHFARIPDERTHPALLAAADWIAASAEVAGSSIPYLWAVDDQDSLCRVVVDHRLMSAARRCQLLWRRLQEHAGIHDSHAGRLLAQEKAKWLAPETRPPAAAPDAEAEAEAKPDAPAADPSAAWIETSRCPSCNECQLINNRMFGYNENKQAVILDIRAGTYRQLVEAAESCQVAIIHPGQPLDPGEPGLAELIERARPFH